MAFGLSSGNYSADVAPLYPSQIHSLEPRSTFFARQPAMLSPADINLHLHTEIPVTRMMGIEVVDFCRTHAHSTAPLEANINHQKSAFGGSIATLGIVTGFVVVWGNLKIHDLKAELVIQHSETEFSKPALASIVAESRSLSDEAIGEFIASFERTGRAQIQVTTDIFSDGKLIAKNRGTFVALTNKT